MNDQARVSQEEMDPTRVSVSDIEFPSLDGVPGMFIIKRYHKQNDENKQYKYLFYPATITDEVVKSLKEVLSVYINYISKLETESIPVYHPDLEEVPCYVELSSENFQYWPCFIEALKLDYNEKKIPRNIKTNLWGYLFYLRTQDYAVGYAKKLSKSKIVKKRFLKGGLVDRNSVRFNSVEEVDEKGTILIFSSVEEIEGIEFDDSADFVFVVKFSEEDPNQVESSWGIIWNKNKFELLLDVYEHQKERAMKILGQCRTLPQLLSGEDLANLKSTVEGNRQLHKMLLNPVTAKYMNEVTIDDFKEVKEKFRDVSFDIDEKNQKIILPSPDSEDYLKAVREVLGIIGARFGKTINNQHIFKGKPEEIR